MRQANVGILTAQQRKEIFQDIAVLLQKRGIQLSPNQHALSDFTSTLTFANTPPSSRRLRLAAARLAWIEETFGILVG